MNNSLKPCDSRLEEISLHAAGCLPESESRELLKHAATCQGCQTRLDEMVTLTSGLRIVKPDIDARRVREIERSLSLRQLPIQKRDRIVPARLMRMMLVAATILVLVGVLSQFVFHEERPAVVEVIPIVPSHVVPEGAGDSPLPTLIALRRAASESDESLDKLLAQYSAHIFSESPHPQSPGIVQ